MSAEFEQFKGPGMKYAPKPKPAAPRPAQPFAKSAPAGPSEEDKMRETLMSERKLRYNRRAQSTDHMN